MRISMACCSLSNIGKTLFVKIKPEAAGRPLHPIKHGDYNTAVQPDTQNSPPPGQAGGGAETLPRYASQVEMQRFD
jgi:hypothetical protein